MSKPYTILLSGATGFVGGTILTTLQTLHPEIHIKALIRNPSAAATLQSLHPTLSPLIGDLSSLPLLRSESSTCDLVIHAGGGDNIPAVRAMLDGLASSPSHPPTSPPTPRLISITGLRSLIDPSLPITGNFPEKNAGRVWSDVADAEEILSLPGERPHAESDRAIVAYAAERGLGAVLISPGQLWGRGRGMKGESNSGVYYDAVKARGSAFVVGEGTARWSWVSIGDLGRAVAMLVGKVREGDRGVEVNEQGYYFVRTGEVSLRERAEAVSERLGLGEVESVSVETVRGIHPFGHIMWGCGERVRADRLEALGWMPRDTDWRVLMEEEGGERA